MLAIFYVSSVFSSNELTTLLILISSNIAFTAFGEKSSLKFQILPFIQANLEDKNKVTADIFCPNWRPSKMVSISDYRL